jgi:ferredoxin-type protein NapH
MRQRVRKGILAFSALMFPLTFFFLSAVGGAVNGSAIGFGLSQKR